jgi:hypothetical protein
VFRAIVPCLTAILLSGCFDKATPQDPVGRFQIATFPKGGNTSPNEALILDTSEGGLWLWSDAPSGPSFKFMGTANQKVFYNDPVTKRLTATLPPGWSIKRIK